MHVAVSHVLLGGLSGQKVTSSARTGTQGQGVEIQRIKRATVGRSGPSWDCPGPAPCGAAGGATKVSQTRLSPLEVKAGWTGPPSRRPSTSTSFSVV